MTAAPRVVLFHRDLRLHDNPTLDAAAAGGNPVVPLFVVDPDLPAGPNRRRFLAACLADLRDSLRTHGADLVVRRGDPATEAVRLATRLGAAGIDVAADVSAYAQARQRRLADACARQRLPLALHPGVTVVPPGTLRPSGGGDHYRVFTPYWRAWQRQRWREEAPTPKSLTLPDGVTGDNPARHLDRSRDTSPDIVEGGETAGLRRMSGWLERSAGAYSDIRDDLAADLTTRLSAYLHFGCVSARRLAARSEHVPELLRQLCWRDFYHQVLAGFPQLPRRAYRQGVTESWEYDSDALAAWQSGHTGVPIVDAGMRQLAAQGYLPNRARLITATYLTKLLRLDWRDGAAWYHHLLVDADVANNYGNWQWVAGTGHDSRPYRGFNPIRQAHRFDPRGDYVRRWVPELADLPGPDVHQPWRLPGWAQRKSPYPAPMGLATERS